MAAGSTEMAPPPEPISIPACLHLKPGALRRHDQISLYLGQAHSGLTDASSSHPAKPALPALRRLRAGDLAVQEGSSFVVPPGGPVGGGEVVAGGQGAGVGVAEGAFAVGE